ncbi:hypothetical protein VHUM_03753 [Vanrija humicola]|uniref:Uncharacterized protein n=1 Tax=Vanrija humicola TaxID=5417 RepID=A0A7D8UZD3_VANHU|nr:hypothetical protein VHUM_03753 [Vanrija humicola]
MSLPTRIGDPSPHDPLVVLPLPEKLPASPLPQLHDLAGQLNAHLGNEPAPDLPVLTAQMRSTTRASQVLLNAARAGATDARAGLDEADVALRTVMYELDRVREEMAQCMSYEPMYETLDIPDEEAFLASADAEVLAADDGEARDQALIIARLEAELAAIMEREGTVAELTAERDALVQTRRDLKKSYKDVADFLDDYARVSGRLASQGDRKAHITRPRPRWHPRSRASQRPPRPKPPFPRPSRRPRPRPQHSSSQRIFPALPIPCRNDASVCSPSEVSVREGGRAEREPAAWPEGRTRAL